eukprot:1136700-Pelagomonas_calceolata.AAC.1
MLCNFTAYPLTFLQRSTFCCCAAFNFCPGLVPSQYLVSIRCACCWVAPHTLVPSNRFAPHTYT